MLSLPKDANEIMVMGTGVAGYLPETLRFLAKKTKYFQTWTM